MKNEKNLVLRAVYLDVKDDKAIQDLVFEYTNNKGKLIKSDLNYRSTRSELTRKLVHLGLEHVKADPGCLGD